MHACMHAYLHLSAVAEAFEAQELPITAALELQDPCTLIWDNQGNPMALKQQLSVATCWRMKRHLNFQAVAIVAVSINT